MFDWAIFFGVVSSGLSLTGLCTVAQWHQAMRQQGAKPLPSSAASLRPRVPPPPRPPACESPSGRPTGCTCRIDWCAPLCPACHRVEEDRRRTEAFWPTFCRWVGRSLSSLRARVPTREQEVVQAEEEAERLLREAEAIQINATGRRRMLPPAERDLLDQINALRYKAVLGLPCPECWAPRGSHHYKGCITQTCEECGGFHGWWHEEECKWFDPPFS